MSPVTQGVLRDSICTGFQRLPYKFVTHLRSYQGPTIQSNRCAIQADVLKHDVMFYWSYSVFCRMHFPRSHPQFIGSLANPHLYLHHAIIIASHGFTWTDAVTYPYHGQDELPYRWNNHNRIIIDIHLVFHPCVSNILWYVNVWICHHSIWTHMYLCSFHWLHRQLHAIRYKE